MVPLAYPPLIVFHVELSSMVFLQSVWLHVPLLNLPLPLSTLQDGSTLPFIIFYALIFVCSCSLFTHKPKALPSLTMFFLLKTLIGKSTTIYLFCFLVFSTSPP